MVNKYSVAGMAIITGCTIALAVPAARAQMQNGWSGNPAVNNAESRHYMRLLQTNWYFRQAEIRKECGPINDVQLRHNCMASFDYYTPFVGSSRLAGNEWYPPNRRSMGAYNTREGLTGGSTGTMDTTAGDYYGSVNPNNYTVPLNQYGASRNLPAEYSSGTVQANGAMPNYPGPRLSGPLSGGGR